MLMLLLLATLALAGLRLAGNTSVPFQATAHIFCGFLLGLAVGGGSWVVWLYLLLLCVTESYAFLSKYFPAIAISTLVKKL